MALALVYYRDTPQFFIFLHLRRTLALVPLIPIVCIETSVFIYSETVKYTFVKLLTHFIVARGIRRYAYIMAMQSNDRDNDRDIEGEKGRPDIEQQIAMFFDIFLHSSSEQ